MTGFVMVHSTVNGLRFWSSRPPTRFAAVLPSSRRSRPAQKAGSGAGEDDDVDAVISFGVEERDGEGSLQLAVHGVAGVGTVERDRAHALGGLGQNRFAHAVDTSNASRHEHSRAPTGRYRGAYEAMLESRPNIGTASEFVRA